MSFTLRISHIALLCLSSISSLARAGEKNPAVVFDPTAPLSDERLHDVHDVDHPVMFDPHYQDKAQWEERARALREQVLVAEGLWPEPVRSPLNAVIHGKIEREGYTIEKVFFASMPGHYVSGSLYRPTNRAGKFPAVLSPHGHWGKGETGGRMYDAGEKAAAREIESGAEKTLAGARYPLQARCAMLAQMGCVVFQYDMVGYADSQSIAHRAGFTDVENVLRLQSFMGLQTWNSIRALDFVCSLPEVDTARLACTGASGGGTQTILLSVIDSRLAVSFPAVMVSEAMQGGCICENAPLLRVNTNNAELISCFAPKPLGMTSANDWTAEIETKGFPEIRDIYKLYGAADKVAAWHRSFPHNYNQVSRELMYNWMNQYLKLGLAEPVTEKAFVPVPPSELSVYDAGHPRPADSLDAAALGREMTAASDAQLTAIARNMPEYRRIVSAALQAMVNDTLPASDNVFIGDSHSGKILENRFTIQKGIIGRKNSGWQTPYVAIVPNATNGAVIVWCHPDGKASLLDVKGGVRPDVEKPLADGYLVIAPDLFLTGESTGPAGRPEPKSNQYSTQTPYAGFYYGYNRGVLANRVSDVLSTIRVARGWKGMRSVRLAGFAGVGVPVILARAIAGSAVDRVSVDLAHFSFLSVQSETDDSLLPGSLKYGDIVGLAACSDQKTDLWNVGDVLPFGIKPIPEMKIHADALKPDTLIKSLTSDSQ